MKTLYAIIHTYDVDGGFGDAVTQEETLGVFSDERKAKEYVDKYHNPRVYSRPYSDLWEHSLRIEEIEVDTLDINKSPWEEEDESSTEINYKFFKRIAEYGSENWKGNFSEEELREYTEDYLYEFESSIDDEPTETIKELYRLLVEDDSKECLEWAYTIATELNLIDMDYMDYMETDPEIIRKFLEGK